MHKPLSAMNTEPSNTADLDRSRDVNIVLRYFGGRTASTQEFILNHLGKQRAKQRAQAQQPRRKKAMSWKDEALNLRLDLEIATGKHQGIV